MAKKRLLTAENDDGLPRERKRPTLLSVGREVIKLQLMQRLLEPILEPVIRRVVREELEHKFLQFIPSDPRPSINQIQAPRAIGPKLQFNSRLSDELFTCSGIPPIQVVIRSGDSEEPMTTGPLSSIRVEMVVLDGDFGRDGSVDWAKEDFDATVVRPRDGRRPLLTGDLFLALKEGVVTFGNITFTDNSSWTRSRRFRLGVRVVQSSGTKERIREARSEPFVVKDHRGESNKKHVSPFLGDEIWRLKNIGKDGVFRKRLNANGIETVQQFLQFLVTDPARLRSMLGMSNKVWEETVRHAQKCILDDKSYIYFSTGQKVALLLNSIYEVETVTFDACQSFQSMDSLTPCQKGLVENLKQQAYRNQEGIVEFNGLPFFGPSRPLPELLQPASFPETSLSLQNPGLIAHQNDLAVLDFIHSTNPSPQGQLMVDLPQLKGIFLPDVHLRQQLAPTQSNSFNMLLVDQPQLESTAIPQDLQLSPPFTPIHSNTFEVTDLMHVPYGDSGDRWPASGLAGTIAPNLQLLGEYPQVQMPNWFNRSVQFSSHEMGTTSFLNNSTLPDHSSISLGIVESKGWRKLGAPLKWRILARKDVAAKRMAESCT